MQVFPKSNSREEVFQLEDVDRIMVVKRDVWKTWFLRNVETNWGACPVMSTILKELLNNKKPRSTRVERDRERHEHT